MTRDFPFSVVPMPGFDLSEQRFHVVVTATGQVVDDAQGHGFKSREAAERRMMFCGASGVYLKDRQVSSAGPKTSKKPFSPKQMPGGDPANPVYCMVDNATGQIVDDNGGVRYKSAASAAGSWSYRRQRAARRDA